MGTGERGARPRGLTERPLYFVSSNTHSLVNIVTGHGARARAELVAFVEAMDDDDILRQELHAFREGETEGSWENFLYFVARRYFSARGAEGAAERRAAEQANGVKHLRVEHRAEGSGAGHPAGRAERPRSTRGSARWIPRRSRRATR